jgi:hypothetical protein
MLALHTADSELVVGATASVIFGVICAAVAAGRGRSGIAWFCIGFFFQCIGLILVLVLPDLKLQEAQGNRHALENRRLREQLAKERQVADQRHHHVERRLGAHDQALGVDTSQAPQLGAAGAPPGLPDGMQWFYARGKERMGPVSTETLRHLLQARAIDGTTLVWRDGMPDWLAANKTDAFRGDVA